MHSLALALLQSDSTPDPQHISNAAAGLGIGMVLFFVLFIFAILAFVVYCLWRIFTKAGLSPALAFLIFVPGVGSAIVLCILAFMDWKVVPAPSFGYIPPAPATAYPPAYPPAVAAAPVYPPPPPVAAPAPPAAPTAFPPEDIS
jgi:hypothetical protein